MDQVTEAPGRGYAGVGMVGLRSTRRRVGSRQFCFAVTFTAMTLAKLAHLHAHRHSISALDFALWGATFFLYDIVILLLARAITDHWSRSIPRLMGAVIAILFSIILLGMASVTVSFYLVAGAEVHWRQLTTFLHDSTGAKTLQSESLGCVLMSLVILAIAWLVTPYAHSLVGQVFLYLPTFIKRWFSVRPIRHQDYIQVDQADDPYYDSFSDGEEPKLEWEEEDQQGSDLAGEKPNRRLWVVLVPFTFLMLLRAFRPPLQTYSNLSQTLALSPWSNLGHGSGIDMASLVGSPTFGGQCDSEGVPPAYDWLPKEKLAGFEDWYLTQNGTQPLHYSPARDCSHISNLANDFLEPIRAALRDNDMNIKHILLIKLESTRKDVFPLVKGSYLWNRIAETHPDNQLPKEVKESLSNLGNTIEYLTGDSTAGNGQREANRSRGGISASDAFTASTYTLKSIIGSLCGIMPLTTDFNKEYRSHIYNPCISHVLEAFNQQREADQKTDDFTTWPWRSVWMQSVTDGFDRQKFLTPVLGFSESITKETIKDPHAKHWPPHSQDINYFGLADTELKPYLRSAISDAEQKQERLFITHLTGTTHHPWALPPDFPMKDYIGYSPFGSTLNSYLNTIKFIDDWLADILTILNETGVSNETLIVMAGDHGVSLPEDGGITPFDNPQVGVFRVPLIFSHPALPPVKVDAPVSTMDILPTTLDLLISSDSLDRKSRKVAADVLPLYEGQSMLRPMEHFSKDGHRSWHYTVMNSGGSWLAMRSTTASYRVAVPLVKEVSWRFTNLESDPQEGSPIESFDWSEFLSEVKEAHGQKAADWLEDAAMAADWWLAKNRRLWRWNEK